MTIVRNKASEVDLLHKVQSILTVKQAENTQSPSGRIKVDCGNDCNTIKGWGKVEKGGNVLCVLVRENTSHFKRRVRKK